MVKMLGTEWVAPGDGETDGRLARILLDHGPRARIPILTGRRTALSLTGGRIQEYDLERMEVAIRQGRW